MTRPEHWGHLTHPNVLVSARRVAQELGHPALEGQRTLLVAGPADLRTRRHPLSGDPCFAGRFQETAEPGRDLSGCSRRDVAISSAGRTTASGPQPGDHVPDPLALAATLVDGPIRSGDLWVACPTSRGLQPSTRFCRRPPTLGMRLSVGYLSADEPPTTTSEGPIADAGNMERR